MADDTARTTLLVPIDNQGVNPATLELLVRIAQHLDRRLLGLILENPRLARVAELPFTTEILLGSGVERSLERDHLSRHHSQVTADTRRRLLALARQARIELSFEEDRGERWHSALTRADGLDIFMLPHRRWQSLAGRSLPDRRAIPRLGLLMGKDELDCRLVTTALALEEAGLVGSVYALYTGKPDMETCAPLLLGRARCHVQSGAPADAAGLTSLIRRSPYDLLIIGRQRLANIPAEVLDSALEAAGGQVMVVS
ncbi:hypothetical protein DWB85_08205 [Seongchinamella sediminis]|uniref:Universal stress protein n=1 Tax=Seongchinamella sediminis TaxID=2283635 RepID=A0A3L7E017_9GAMM|nr:hypothetical protein [Seongchinamella sediminis]RLQ22259.1 hypothetical protein DWB85_08205 [Seongchinamella sediminis]